MAASCRLAAVLIARDESRCIKRCLQSLTGAVDKIILLDTGSVDATASIASALGAEVHHTSWSNDFAAARNLALEIAAATWNLCIDADEWLVAGHGELRELTPHSPVHVGRIKVVSSFDDGDDLAAARPDDSLSFAPSWISRLLPGGVRYMGRVHEQPIHAFPVRQTTIVYGHDGYLTQYRPKKADRNRRLLLRELAECPDDAYLAYQLGKDHEVRGEYLEAASWYTQALHHSMPDDGYAHDLLIRQIYTLKCLGRHADAVQLAECEMAHWSVSPDLYFTLGDVLLDWAAVEPERAGELLPMAEASWRRCVDIGENDAHEGAVAGRGSWLAAHNLSVLCDGTGRATEADGWRANADRWRTAASSTGA